MITAATALGYHVKRSHSPYRSIGKLLIFLCEPVGEYTIESVMNGWCDARLTITFPVADHCQG